MAYNPIVLGARIIRAYGRLKVRNTYWNDPYAKSVSEINHIRKALIRNRINGKSLEKIAVD